jgi:hypothetical protein
MPDVPLYVKSLPFARASDGEVMVAYAINDAPLPMLNGFPLRLVVPGWFATYWVKSLNEINVMAEKFSGFWMDKAYRIPNNPDAIESPQQLATDTVPITRHTVRSLIVTPEEGAIIEPGKAVEIDGIAFDAGEGITKVEISADEGRSWIKTSLGNDLGRYSFRRWHATWKPPTAGRFTIMARATNAAGDTQVARQRWNRSGYQRNVIEQVHIEVPLY